MPKAMPRNIDYFSILAAAILVQLYTNFPSPQDMHSDDFDFEAVDPDEDQYRLRVLWSNTIHWLADEAYIRFKTEKADRNDGSAFNELVLTQKGFEVLSKPAPNNGLDTIGDALSVAFGQLDGPSARDQVDILIRSALIS